MIFGPPGSGKGTYATRLQSKFDIPAISTGDILREMAKEETQLAKEIREFMSKGELVPDKIVIEILKEKLAEDVSKNGFILDGYPRTLGQAKALENFTRNDAIIRLRVPEWILVERLSSRRICKACGAVYNIRFLKPKNPGICDKCGGQLYQRIDDTPKLIKERLKVYERQTRPLIEYYKGKVPFVESNTEKIDIPPDIAVAEIIKGLKKLNLPLKGKLG
ncbi:MAG: nucleoside monophosphate kinase [Candidatus Bathyarchaeota archaeon]|nr:MAG: nucleoside monophosphate kinase [Candidatus Bathyarchaeota archaeon]